MQIGVKQYYSAELRENIQAVTTEMRLANNARIE